MTLDLPNESYLRSHGQFRSTPPGCNMAVGRVGCTVHEFGASELQCSLVEEIAWIATGPPATASLHVRSATLSLPDWSTTLHP